MECSCEATGIRDGLGLSCTEKPPLAPRHFKTSIISSAAAFDRSRKRTAAGEDSCAAPGDRYRNPTLRPASAASCSLRVSRFLMSVGQPMTAPNDLHRNVCSRAQRISAGFSARIIRSRSSRTPWLFSAGAKGMYGGEMSATCCSDAVMLAITGISKRNSPMAVCVGMSSTIVPDCQPPCGNTASSSALPVARITEGTAPSRRHARASCSKASARVMVQGFFIPVRMIPTASPSIVSSCFRKSISIER